MSYAQDHIVEHLAEGIGWRERPGSGAVLVCLHGIGSQARAFDALLPHLPADLRVIAWEAPGYGPSAPLANEWPLAADYAAALARLVRRLDLPRFHLLGHSLGTLIGAAFAVAHPQRLISLTLASCAQGMGLARGEPLPASAAARIADLERLGPVAFARERAARLVFRPQGNPAIVEAVRDGMAAVSLPGYAQAVRMLTSGDLAGDCARLKVPTTVIVGAEDIVTPPTQSERAFAALPAASRRRLLHVPGAGHALHQQAPAALAAALALHPETPADQSAQPACAPMEE